MKSSSPPARYPSPPNSPELTRSPSDTSTAPLRASAPTDEFDTDEAGQGTTRTRAPTRPTPGLSRRTSGTRGPASAGMSSKGRSGQGESRAGRGESAGGVEAERRARMPLAPPVDPELFESDEEWRKYHETEKTEGWHHLPLLLVVLPPLGAIVHGRAENWSDAIILVLICFYLYHLIKVPWDLYYASHGRHVIHATMPTDGAPPEDPLVSERRLSAASILRRTELLSLAFTLIVPALGSYLLYFVRELLSDPDRYINKFTISLFALATSVKPLLHVSGLIKNSSLYYQEAVHYPSTEVYLLRRRIEGLEKDISQITRAFATKDDVRILRDGVDIPLGQLSKAVRRFDRKEEFLRLSSEERFAILDAKLEEAAREVAANSELIDRLRQEQEKAIHPIAAVFKVLNHIRQGPLWYVFIPVNASLSAVEWIQGTSSADGQHEDRKRLTSRRNSG